MTWDLSIYIEPKLSKGSYDVIVDVVDLEDMDTLESFNFNFIGCDRERACYAAFEVVKERVSWLGDIKISVVCPTIDRIQAMLEEKEKLKYEDWRDYSFYLDDISSILIDNGYFLDGARLSRAAEVSE